MAAIFAVSGVCSAARWYEDYERAVELIGDGNCSREALELLGAAVVDKPRPRLQARTIAMRVIDYLPYYQLARAHLACGDADSARHYLNISREKGVAPASSLDELEQQVVDLEAQTEPAEAPGVDPEELARRVRTATDTIREARSLASQIDSRRAESRFTSFFQDNSVILEQSAAELRDAEERLNEGTLKRDLGTIETALSSASRVVQAYSELEGRLAALELTTPTAIPVVRQPPPTATPVPPRPRPTAVEPFPTPRATAVVPELPGTTRSQPAGGAPTLLRMAAADYLKGEYENVVTMLDPEAFSEVREQAAAYLLRAAAHFAMYCLSGRIDGEALDMAHGDLGRWNEINAGPEPDPRFFSPEFVALTRSIQ